MHYTQYLQARLHTKRRFESASKTLHRRSRSSVPDLDKIAELNEEIKTMGGYVALSNSEDVFKIKCETSDITALKEFNLAVYNWGQENGFKVKKLDGKEVFYITGKDE